MLNTQTLSKLTGFGSVEGVPQLSAGFADVFASYRVDTLRIGLHAVIGGSGPPLLLLAGWPQCWYAWRELMLPLARTYRVIAVDPRGVGRSDKPKDGYDSLAQAADMFGLMDELGHEEFAMLGHDIGLWTAFAMAASNPGRIERLAVGEALIPGVSPSPPLLPAQRAISDRLSHFNFNRMLGMNEALVRGREEIYFGHQFASKAASPEAVPASARAFYIECLRNRDSLCASFEFYRALDTSIPQHQTLSKGAKIEVPVFTFAGRQCCGDLVDEEWRQIASNVESIVIEDCGHYPAEEQPEILLEAVSRFLDPYGRAQTA